MEEALENVDSLVHGLKEDLHTARAAKEVAEELRQSMENRLVQVNDEVHQLKGELKSAHLTIAEQGAGWRKSKKQVDSLEQAARENQEKIEILTKAAEEAARRAEEAVLESEAAKRESAALRKLVDDAVADFRKSSQFQEEMNEASLYGYQHGFNDRLSKVKETFPHPDFSGIPPFNIAEEEEEGEEEAEEAPCPGEEAFASVEDLGVTPTLILVQEEVQVGEVQAEGSLVPAQIDEVLSAQVDKLLQSCGVGSPPVDVE